MAGAIFDTPIATVSLVEQDRVWLAACQGLTGVREVGKEPGLCASVIAQDDVYVINNAASTRARSSTRWSAASWACGSTPPRRSAPTTATAWARST